MRFWLVRWTGSWLGGKAIVIAAGPDAAIALVRNDSRTTNFEDVSIEEVSGPTLYHYDGDY